MLTVIIQWVIMSVDWRHSPTMTNTQLTEAKQQIRSRSPLLTGSPFLLSSCGRVVIVTIQVGSLHVDFSLLSQPFTSSLCERDNIDLFCLFVLISQKYIRHSAKFHEVWVGYGGKTINNPTTKLKINFQSLKPDAQKVKMHVKIQQTLLESRVMFLLNIETLSARLTLKVNAFSTTAKSRQLFYWRHFCCLRTCSTPLGGEIHPCHGVPDATANQATMCVFFFSITLMI